MSRISQTKSNKHIFWPQNSFMIYLKLILLLVVVIKRLPSTIAEVDVKILTYFVWKLKNSSFAIIWMQSFHNGWKLWKPFHVQRCSSHQSFYIYSFSLWSFLLPSGKAFAVDSSWHKVLYLASPPSFSFILCLNFLF